MMREGWTSGCSDAAMGLTDEGLYLIENGDEVTTPRLAVHDAVLQWVQLASEQAEHFDLDPYLVLAVIATESGGNPDAGSRAGAIGLMQLMPGTAAYLAKPDPPPTRQQAIDPAWNVEHGCKLLRQLIDREKGNVVRALISYNAGHVRCSSRTIWRAVMDVGKHDYVTTVAAYRNDAVARSLVAGTDQPGVITAGAGSGASGAMAAAVAGGLAWLAWKVLS